MCSEAKQIWSECMSGRQNRKKKSWSEIKQLPEPYIHRKSFDVSFFSSHNPSFRFLYWFLDYYYLCLPLLLLLKIKFFSFNVIARVQQTYTQSNITNKIALTETERSACKNCWKIKSVQLSYGKYIVLHVSLWANSFSLGKNRKNRKALWHNRKNNSTKNI